MCKSSLIQNKCPCSALTHTNTLDCLTYAKDITTKCSKFLQAVIKLELYLEIRALIIEAVGFDVVNTKIWFAISKLEQYRSLSNTWNRAQIANQDKTFIINTEALLDKRQVRHDTKFIHEVIAE